MKRGSLSIVVSMVLAGIGLAGSLDPPAPPGPTMYTLEEIYLAVVGDSNIVNTSSGTAAAPDILDGKSAWVKGGEVIGTMPNVGQQNFIPGMAAQPIAAGFHDGTGQVAGDAALATGNIRAGVSIFGVAGKPEIVDTASGDATAAELLVGRNAWVQGEEITGTMPIRSLSADSVTVAEGFYAATTLDVVNPDLASSNIRAGVSIFGVAGKPEVADTASGDATAPELLAGRNAWVQGAEIAGTMPVRALSADSVAVAEGFYAATTLNAVDPDLTPDNIKQDIILFGVVGTYDDSGGTYESAVPRTGQTTSYGLDDDGDLQKGVAWPTPRFADHGDGTATDLLTGLTWVTTPHALPGNSSKVTWANALTFCQGLSFAGRDDWRLPNIRELSSVADFSLVNPALTSGHPFTVYYAGYLDYYWTSTTYGPNSNSAWSVIFTSGHYSYADKQGAYWVWPVRGGE